MAIPFTASTRVGSFIRITVCAGDRRLDIGVADTLSVAELIPGFAKALGRLGPAEAHAGYQLVTQEGRALDPAATLVDQGVGDGAVLTLVAGVDREDHKVYDDIVEAIADAVDHDQSRWTAADSSRVTLAAAATAVLVAALVLVGLRGNGFAPAIVAGIGAALLLASAAVMARLGNALSSAVVGLCGCVLAAAAGFLAGGAGPLWAWPMTQAGAACAGAGMAMVAAVPAYREFCLAPIAAGLGVAAAGLLVATDVLAPQSASALLLALAVTIGNAVSWLALSASRIPVAQVGSDAAAPLVQVVPQDVSARTSCAHRLILAGRAAVMVIVFVTIPALAGQGGVCLALVVTALAGLMASTRRCHARSEVGLVMVGSLAGLALAAVTAVSTHPQWAWPAALVLLAVAGVVIAAALLPSGARLGLGRVVDAIDLAATVTLLPLAIIASGLV